MSIKLEDLMKKRFLFEGDEVQLTGRVGKRRIGRKDLLIFEIRPTEIGRPAWKKWVRLQDMYEIFNPLSHRVEYAEDLLDAVRRANKLKGGQ